MPRQQTPLARAKLTGADAKNPQRFRNRSDPTTSKAPVGNPPAYLAKEAKAVWRDLACNLGWLVKEDRFALESACLAIAQVRTMHRAGDPITGAMFAAMNVAIGKLGASPTDRSKVFQEPDDDDDDEFAQFGGMQ